MRNYEQYKRIVKFTFSALVIALEMVVFWYNWLHFYNPKLKTLITAQVIGLS